MKTANYEISKELAGKLALNGYVYDNLRVFRSDYRQDLKTLSNLEHKWCRSIQSESFRWDELTPAFTMCELWDMLPCRLQNEEYVFRPNLIKGHTYNLYSFHSFLKGNDYSESTGKDKNPCNALAKLVIWCIENNQPLNLKKV